MQTGPDGPRRGVRVWASVSCCPGAEVTYRNSSKLHTNMNKICYKRYNPNGTVNVFFFRSVHL